MKIDFNPYNYGTNARNISQLASSVDEDSSNLAKPSHIHDLLPSTQNYILGSETDDDGKFDLADQDISFIDSTIDPLNLIGETFRDSYKVEEFLAKGGMSYVYKALDIENSRHVAIKIIKNLGLDLKDAFSREIKIMERLKHKNILKKINDSKNESDIPYLVTEFMDGGTLKEPKINLSLKQKILILADICDALQYIHDNNIIHRDIKPENILLSDELTNNEHSIYPIARLADFGLAIETPNIYRNNAISGSAPYMSPEQANGKNNSLNGRSDLYSIGIILYELIAGKVPFDGNGDFLTVLNQQRTSLPTALSLVNINIVNIGTLLNLEPIIMKLLQKNPEDRGYKSAYDLAKDLRSIVTLRF